MSESFNIQLKAPGQVLLDAAPGPVLSSGSSLFACYHPSSPTVSNASGMQNAPRLPQQQPSFSHRLPLTANKSSYSFSFCGSDAFGVNDAVNCDTMHPPAQPPQQLSHDTLQQPQFALSLSNNSSGFHNAPPSHYNSQVSGVDTNPVSLSAANLEYFYGIPTPSAPSRPPYGTSSESNCSSTHSHQRQRHQTSASGESPLTASSSTHLSTDSSAGAGGDLTSFQAGMQKDVLAFMAAEQQQQKFVLQQRNVYMSGLPVDFRPSAFRAMCEVFGHIESSKLCMEADDANRCRGFGFVLFNDVESANSCITSLNGKMMQGKMLQVRRADLSAAPQPLNPVTQRNRTGSGLVTPPSLSKIGRNDSSNNSISISNAVCRHAAGSGTSGGPAATAYSMFRPHPPSANASNTVAPSVVMSALPFTFATPTMLAPAPNNSSKMLPQKGSTSGSSFMYGGPSASSSLGTSSSPTIVYPSSTTVVSTMRNGVPIMQMYAPCPAPSSTSMLPQQQQQQQQQQLVSHPSMNRSDVATSHAPTPSSVGSSMNLAFVSPSQLMLHQPSQQQSSSQQQQQQQQQQMHLQPQPPMHPPMQPQRPLTAGANVAFYSIVDDQRTAVAPVNSSSSAAVVQSSSVYAPNMLVQEYLTAAGLDPTASNSNIYYFFPQ